MKWNPLHCLARPLVITLFSFALVTAAWHPVAIAAVWQTEAETDARGTSDWRLERIVLEKQFADELESLASVWDQQGKQDQAAQARQLAIPRDPHRQYIFLPSTNTMPQPDGGPTDEWIGELNQVRHRHADRILDLARRAADAEAGAVAFQLLHEVIHYDRDHEAARAMLGHRLRDGQWQVVADSITARRAGRAQEQFGWPPGSYLEVRTPHFEIESAASEERTRFLAEQLERCYAVWRQVFFEYWCKSSLVRRWIDGSSQARPFLRGRRYKVVFFPNKGAYVAELAKRVVGIEQSTGYYSNAERVSFFYDGGSQEQDTWRHELTHQLFRESPGTNENAFEDRFFWVDEAVATYFESLCDFDDYAVLGGFDTRRLQFARLRRLLENYYVPLEELSEIGRTSFQKRADMRLLYSQGAGIMNMLLNDGHGAYEQSTVEFLRLVYKGRLRSGSFEEITGHEYAFFDQQYTDFLKVDSETVTRFLLQPDRRTELSVADADLQTPAYRSIGRCTELRWLDLSGNSVSPTQLALLKDCQQLGQLFLARATLEPDALRGLTSLNNLTELELSGSNVTDDHLAVLADLPALTRVRVAGTRITDAGLVHLSRIPLLASVDLAQSAVSTEGVMRFRAARPSVAITR